MKDSMKKLTTEIIKKLDGRNISDDNVVSSTPSGEGIEVDYIFNDTEYRIFINWGSFGLLGML